MVITHTKTAIMITLWAVQKRAEKNYSTLPVNYALGLLAKIHEITIGRRWYFQCFQDLEAAGLVRRKKRYRNKSDGTINQIPSVITFTIPGLKHLVKNKVSGAYKALKAMINWIQGNDRRFPQPDELLPNISDDERRRNLQKLKLLFGGKGFD